MIAPGELVLHQIYSQDMGDGYSRLFMSMDGDVWSFLEFNNRRAMWIADDCTWSTFWRYIMAHVAIVYEELLDAS